MVLKSPRANKTPRLVFCERSTSRGGVDGAWLPGSNNLGAELPDLLAVIGSMIGEVRRVVYDPRAWTKTPSRMIRHGVAISVDPYTMVTSETIYLIGTHSRDAVLYVFPQTSAVAVVDRVLDAIRASDAPMDTSVLRHLVVRFSGAEAETA
jgi:hypothetical protein